MHFQKKEKNIPRKIKTNLKISASSKFLTGHGPGPVIVSYRFTPWQLAVGNFVRLYSCSKY